LFDGDDDRMIEVVGAVVVGGDRIASCVVVE
jgi:hypothetical protein